MKILYIKRLIQAAIVSMSMISLSYAIEPYSGPILGDGMVINDNKRKLIISIDKNSFKAGEDVKLSVAYISQDSREEYEPSGWNNVFSLKPNSYNSYANARDISYITYKTGIMRNNQCEIENKVDFYGKEVDITLLRKEKNYVVIKLKFNSRNFHAIQEVKVNGCELALPKVATKEIIIDGLLLEKDNNTLTMVF